MPTSTRALIGLVVVLLLASPVSLAAPATAPAPVTQPTSAFYPPRLLERIRANAEKDDWGRDIRARAIAAAEPWRKMSDEQLWSMVFGATTSKGGVRLRSR